MEPCGTLARILNQDQHWPFKTTFSFLLVKKSFSILIKSLHIPFDAVSKSVQLARLYQRLLRHQGISLEPQGLYRKHLKFHD